MVDDRSKTPLQIILDGEKRSGDEDRIRAVLTQAGIRLDGWKLVRLGFSKESGPSRFNPQANESVSTVWLVAQQPGASQRVAFGFSLKTASEYTEPGPDKRKVSGFQKFSIDRYRAPDEGQRREKGAASFSAWYDLKQGRPDFENPQCIENDLANPMLGELVGEGSTMASQAAIARQFEKPEDQKKFAKDTWSKAERLIRSVEVLVQAPQPAQSAPRP